MATWRMSLAAQEAEQRFLLPFSPSDPNRFDGPEYIVRLVGQVVRVSLETVRIVADLPAKFSP
jgi:hypothetical protein